MPLANRLSKAVQFSSVQLLNRVWLFVTHEPQHTRPPCPSPTPKAEAVVNQSPPLWMFGPSGLQFFDFFCFVFFLCLLTTALTERLESDIIALGLQGSSGRSWYPDHIFRIIWRSCHYYLVESCLHLSEGTERSESIIYSFRLLGTWKMGRKK